MLMLLVSISGCGNKEKTLVNEKAVCVGLTPYVDRHASALLEDGGPKTVVTGSQLIYAIDLGCGTNPS